VHRIRPLTGAGITARRAHLVGIGGSGMQALAEVLIGLGWRVSGSDLDAMAVQRLGKTGVRIHHGHGERHLARRTDLVVYSDAVAEDNPELLQATAWQIPRLSYFEMAGRLTAERETLAVTGTHGKSTTTAMLGHLLTRAGFDPTVLCGAAPLGRCTGGRAGRSRLAVVEACEYRSHFLHLAPRHAAILGIEPDHFDCFPQPEDAEEAFERFAGSIPADGLLLIPDQCAVSRRIADQLGCHVESFGFGADSDWSAQRLSHRGGRYKFQLYRRWQPLGTVRLRVPGRHNVLNALAAAALAHRRGVQAAQIARGLEAFSGVHRRLEHLGSWGEIAFWDDYAHHPTEVAAALQSVRQATTPRRLWCVFQPHQACRTRRLLDELAESLQNTDKLIVAEIYRVREPVAKPDDVTAADLAARAKQRGAAVVPVHQPEAIAMLLAQRIKPGDVVLTMGAGNIDRVAWSVIGQKRRATTRSAA
jgi:UDP-N-acetylmuramate--alanine ligase